MGELVPYGHFDDCYTRSAQYFSENRIMVIKLCKSQNIVKYIFVVQDPYRCDYHQIFLMKESSPVSLHMRPTYYPDFQWMDILSLINVATCVSLLNTAVSSGLDSFCGKVKECHTKESFDVTLQYENVPDTQLLNSVCANLGRKSVIVRAYCNIICSKIRANNSGAVEVRATYAPGNENEIVFILITRKTSAKEKLLDRPIVHRTIDDVSTEASFVMKKEKAITGKQRKDLRTILDKHTGDLLKQHSNITLISISSIKSTKYATKQATIEYTPCIAIYVRVKGLIPIEEDLLPLTIDGYNTDIRESAFTPYSIESHDRHEHIKMGCLIQGLEDNTNAEGFVLGGTLGGFIDHPTFGLCCITSAHNILSGDDMRAFGSVESFPKIKNLTCFQPNRPYRFGSVARTVCREGDRDTPGMEVVLIKIQNRDIDLEGRFPGTESIEYRSGNILEVNEVIEHLDRDDTCVFKYGAETGITTGNLYFDNATFDNAKHGNWKFSLQKQIEIRSDSVFAKPGDSGALVFHYCQDMKLKVIGILEGGTIHNTYFATPICAVLKAIGMPDPLRMKEFSKMSVEVQRIKSDVEDIKSKLQQQDQKLDKILSFLQRK